MRIACIFSDKPEMLEHRKQFGEDHLAYLEANADEILIAGGFREAPDSDFIGGMWILEVDTFERAKVLVEHDPYYVPALRSYQLRVWGKALDTKVVL